MGLKQCIDCPMGQLKDTSEFHVSRHGKYRDGLKPLCKECGKARRRKWGASNRKREQEWNKAKYEAHPDYFVERANAYRARLRAAFIEDVNPIVLYQMHGGMCGICKEFIEGNFHIDHVIPLSKGGMHGYVNVQPAHPGCNLAKKDKVL